MTLWLTFGQLVFRKTAFVWKVYVKKPRPVIVMTSEEYLSPGGAAKAMILAEKAGQVIVRDKNGPDRLVINSQRRTERLLDGMRR